MRITPGMITSQYGRNLNRSLGELNFRNNRATTLRRFDSVSEDPIRASQAYSLRRSFANNETYLTNVEDTDNLFQTSHSTMLMINNIMQEIGSEDILQAVNGTMTQVDREIVSTKIKKLTEALLTNANAKYGDKYMFNGGNSTSPPFSMDPDGNVLYRGINVNTGKHIGNTAVGGSVTVDGATISFGSESDVLMNDYKIEFTADAVGTNSANTTDKTIKIGTAGATMTAADLQTQLRALTPADLPAGVDPTKITVTGGAATGLGTGSVAGGKTATNAYAEATVGGSIVTFGRENGDLLNGYTINVMAAPLPAGTNAVDNNKKVLNIALAANPPTRADLETALQALPVGGANGLPAGVDPSKITVDGAPDTNITFGSGEINGGEKTITAGTDFSLADLAKESRFLDLGLGLTFDSAGKLNNQSVFNISMPGIDFLGFGVDDDGNPKNVFSLLSKITADLEDPNFNIEKTEPLIAAFNKQRDNLLFRVTKTDAQANFMKFTKERLTETKINLNTKMVSVEMMDPAEAIMDFKMQEYAYMTALKMGSKIIQPTFLDFMS